MKRYLWVGMGLLWLLPGCRRASEEPLALELQVVDARPAHQGIGVGDVDVSLTRRAVSGGVLVGAYTDAASGTTDGEGHCTLNFDRANALDYRLDLEREGWFGERLTFSAEEFEPGQPRRVTVELMPRAEVAIRLIRTGEAQVGDQLMFQTLHIPDRWPTCPKVWHTIPGTVADTSWTCSMPGDAYLPYTYQAVRDGETNTLLDSIWIPAFQTTPLNISW
jgi:hypothetical protein